MTDVYATAVTGEKEGTRKYGNAQSSSKQNLTGFAER
jgi:hypothetical protein